MKPETNVRYTTSVSGALRTVNFIVDDGTDETWFTYSYGPRSPIPYDTDGWDPYEYRLPNGKKYTHPTREGCLLMIMKHFFNGDDA